MPVDFDKTHGDVIDGFEASLLPRRRNPVETGLLAIPRNNTVPKPSTHIVTRELVPIGL